MRTTLFCILLLFVGIITAQTIDNPPFKARSGSIRNITRIERTSEATKVFIHAVFRPHWWIMEEGNCYLEDAVTGTKYPFLKAEGIEINKETYMPDSGEMDYVLYFAPLSEEVVTVHLLAPNSTGWDTYGISLVQPKKGKPTPFEMIKGNWFKADVGNRWEYGIYDSITIAHNRIYTNESIRKKGKSIELVIRNEKEKVRAVLTFVPQKDGNYTIAQNNVNAYLYTKHKNAETACVSEEDFTDFFKKDTAYLQGYINGYDRRLGFETGLVYLENIITREDYPTVVTIHPSGWFEAKLALNYPIETSLVLKDNWLPFYIEPGKTLTMYVDWEAILARSRARGYYSPGFNLQYMGPTAQMSQLLSDLSSLFEFRYGDIVNAQKTLTPNQFKEQMKPRFSEWSQTADSLVRIYAASKKAVHLIRNKVALKKGGVFFDYLMGREYVSEGDAVNQVSKVKEDISYYDFLKEMPLDDKVALTDGRTSVFINRFEYMSPLKKAYPGRLEETDSLKIEYPKKIMLTYLKENGVLLTPGQEQIRLQHEKRAGQSLKVSVKELIAENKVLANIYKDEQPLIKKFFEEQSAAEEAIAKKEKKAEKEPEKSPEEQAKEQLEGMNRILFKKDSILTSVCGLENPLLWQVAKIRSLKFELQNLKQQSLARQYVNDIEKNITDTFFKSEIERVFQTAFPEKEEMSYQLPEGKASDIFRKIIKPHLGKVLFVDFWATSCGPCRSGIEYTAELRKKYKDHPEFQFVYITSQKESSEKAYNEYVEKNLKGEASYYVSETEFNYLRQLFQFSVIPHYRVVEKDGSISKEDVSTYNLEPFLEKRFGKDKP